MLPLNTDAWTVPLTDDFEVIWWLEDKMLGASGQEQDETARKLLRIDPTNIKAYTVLAVHAASPAEAIALARESVRLGNQRWADRANAGERIDWWRDLETRPYMTAILLYGNFLAASGYRDEARAAFETLLDLHPTDGVGARFSLEELNASLPLASEWRRWGRTRSRVPQGPDL